MATAYKRQVSEVRLALQLVQLSQRQYGIFTRRQAIELGFTDGGISWRVRSGQWIRVYPSVYMNASSPRTWASYLRASSFAWGDDAWIAGPAAAAWWGIKPFEPCAAALIVPPDRQRALPHDVIRATLLPADKAIHKGIPVTSPLRTLRDVATMNDDLLEEAVDSALHQGLVSIARLRWYIDAFGGRGKAGMGRLRSTLADRTRAPSESVFESRLFASIKKAGLPLPTRQHTVRLPSGKRARIDFAYVRERVAVEALGFADHGARLRWEKDQARHADLAALGWIVIPITWRMLRRDPSGVAERIAAALVARANLG